MDKEGTVGLHVLSWVQHLFNIYCLLFMGQRDKHSVTHLLLQETPSLSNRGSPKTDSAAESCPQNQNHKEKN